MNRSILIVICDFLLLSLLTFTTDLSKMAGEDEGATATVKADAVPKSDSSGKDLAAVMKQALVEEQKNREQLQAEFAQAQAAAQRQLDQFAQQAKELQQKQSNLEQQYAQAQTNIQNLNLKLQSEALQSKTQLAAKEAEISKQKEQSATLQQQLTQVNGQLQAAQLEKSVEASKVAVIQQQVEAEHVQNAKLAEGFKALATNSGTLTQEILGNHTLAPNAIFNEFITNCVQAYVIAGRTGLLGSDASKTKTSQTILVTDGARIFAVCHVQDTPLTLHDPGTDWEGLGGSLSHNLAQVPIRELSFDQLDPRVVYIPVTVAEAAKLDCKVYSISSDPYKFQDAVVVGMQGDYYGESSFQMDVNTPNYLKLDRSLLKGLFGKFNPTRGDLVFSRTGELLGIMANGTYCLVLHNFATAATLPFGEDVRAQHTGDTLSRLFFVTFQFPVRLQ